MRERSIIASCTSGLANRMLMLAGAQRLARLTQRKLFLYWPENDQLDCPFEALFKNAPAMIRDHDMHELLRSDRTMKVYNAWHCPPLYEEVSPDGEAAEIILLKGWTAPKFANETLASIRDELCEELRRLAPVDELITTADTVALPEQCLGVHVRTGAAGESEKYFAQSKHEHFETILRAVMEQCGDTSFLLATAWPEVEGHFRGVFGDRLIVFPKSGKGRERAAIREALIDLLLLSRTRGVLGHHGSTFSQVAAMLGPRLLLMATETSELAAVAQRFTHALHGAAEHHLEL
jgi:hypothetical protein